MAVPDEKFASYWQHRAAYLAAGPTLTYKHVKQQFEAVLVILRQINQFKSQSYSEIAAKPTILNKV